MLIDDDGRSDDLLARPVAGADHFAPATLTDRGAANQRLLQRGILHRPDTTG